MPSIPDLIAGGAGWRQTARLLTLTTPLGPDVLLAETADIDEALGPLADHAGFRIALTALSVDAHLPLATLLGQPARVDLLTSASRTERRPFHGHITHAARLGADGGFARYRLTIEPWLSFLGHTQDSYLFQDMSVVDIIDELLTDWRGQGHLVPAWRWQLADPALYPRRGMTAQYRESDLAFFKRLLAEEGLFCWFEHQVDTDAALGSHTLMIADDNTAFRDAPHARLRFTQAGATLAEDSLDRWTAIARLDTSSTRAASWDYRSRATRPQAADSATPVGASVPTSATDDPGPYAWQAAADGERMIRRQREAIDARTQQFGGEGSARGAAPGTTFELLDHARHADTDRRRFLITAVTHQARNNLATLRPATADSGEDAGQVDFYRNRLQCVPASVPWRPLMHDGHGRTIHPRPTATGPATAIVVGDCTGRGEPAPTHTDRDHRIRVQFHWQRGSRAASRQPHPGGSDNAPADATRGVWLRVLSPMAGADWGGHFVPRPGQEVLVAFQHGNIDRPVVIGSVYNGQGTPDAAGNRLAGGTQHATANAPAWFAGQSDPAHSHRASLSGLKTQELAASRSGLGGHNQLVFDDTPGEGRIELSTTQHATQLQLGHLKQQTGNARQASRGHGAELATRAAIAVRAGSGLLISADARPDASGHHLDSREAIDQTEQALGLVQRLAGLAPDKAPDPLPATASLARARDTLAATAGHQAPGRDAPSDGIRRTAGGTGTVAAWSSPRIQYSAPAGIALLTPQDQILATGHHLVTATGDAQLVSQGNHGMAARNGIALFTAGKAPNGAKPNTETGIHLHAASGAISVQSQSGKFTAAADRKVTIASTSAAVSASAKKHILATAQGAYLRIEGGDIQLHAPGKVALKASRKNLTGPKATTVKLPSFPVSGLGELASGACGSCTAVFDIGSLIHNDPALFGTGFEVWTRGETPELIARGTLDELNRSFVVSTASAESIELFAGESEWTDFIDSVDHVRDTGEFA
ncbi:type VI secretion system Vgr family protein [Azoarcus sp. DN11]|uniref:type VI secretion system Vgr family protein n=1 Tax=Azoarcus sp. DN11 TaxID=356837 RepID=UPI000EABBE1E|nr:type VI secretion system Vgr family protein [Azoarcus sp. DN11]AYH41945.1 Rhs element Vgr protein [Azoarcus sp. DN11]